MNLLLDNLPNSEWKPRKLRILLWLIISIVFALIQVKQSLFNGQLSLPPTHDDVVYFNDALGRLDILQESGLKGLLADYIQRPPHSPINTLLAFIGFAMFGVHEWVPAAMNSIIVFCTLLFIDYLTRRLNFLSQILVIITSLNCLLMSHAVIEFRPDIFCGLTTAMTIILISEKSLSNLSESRQATIGILFGLSLLIKPTVFPMTIVLVSFAFFIRFLTDIFILKKPSKLIQSVIKNQAIFYYSLGLSLPYYLFAWKPIANYIYQNQVVNLKKIWNMHPLPLQERLSYYLTGQGGAMMLKGWFYIWLALLVSAIVIFVYKKDWIKLHSFLSLISTILVAYSIITISEHKSPFLGVILACFIFFTSPMLLGFINEFILTLNYRFSKQIAISSLTLLFCISLGLYEWPAPNDLVSPDVTTISPVEKQHKRKLISNLYQDISAQDCPIENNNNNQIVKSETCSVKVYMTLITLWLHRDGFLFYHYKFGNLDKVDVRDGALEGDAEIKLDDMKDSDYVVSFNTSNPDIPSWIPGLKVEAQLIDELKQSPNFSLLNTYKNLNGEPIVYLYKKIG